MPIKPPPIGEKFGRLTVIGSVHVGHGRAGHYQWQCRCECGNVTNVQQCAARSGHTVSCGCFNRERVGKLHRRHGMSYQISYVNWQGMIQRCENPKVPHYHRYGGRGITVCDRWKVFENFYADMGERPSPNHSIDRYPNNDGNYEPGNCRWATRREQLLNTRRSIAKRTREFAAKEAKIMTTIVGSADLSETVGKIDGIRRSFGSQSDVGFAASNLIEMLHATQEAEIVPDKPERSTICARTNLLNALPHAQERFARSLSDPQ